MSTTLRNHPTKRIVTAIRLAVLMATFCVVSTATAVEAAASACSASTSASDITAFFDTTATGLLGADYPHSYSLGDGRVLWLFQDAFIGDPGTATLTTAGFAHNVALLQTGLCFELRWGGGAISTPSSFLGGQSESDLSHWWWPLGGELDVDGNLAVFAAEFRNPNGTGAASGAEPVATWRAVIRVSDLAVLSFAPAPDSLDRPLFGFSVTSDDTWSYLYGNCYRQFTTPGFLGQFDVGCTTQVSVARVPRGHFEQAPAYWDGSTWVADRAAAAVVHSDGTLADPLQVRRIGTSAYMAISHLDDWFGTSIMGYASTSPTGPFTQYTEVDVPRLCGSDCTNYAAMFTPWRTSTGAVEVAISNFTWDFQLSNQTPRLYRPSVVEVPAPFGSNPGDELVTIDGSGIRLPVAGRNGVSPTASAAVLTIAATDATQNGYVTVWPCGTTRPLASSLNLAPGSIAGNSVVAPIGEDGRVCLWTYPRASLVVDVDGWMTSTSDYHALTPTRLLDTRPGYSYWSPLGTTTGTLQPGRVTEVKIAGKDTIPNGAGAVAVNVTAVGADGAGYISLWPCDAPQTSSTVNTIAGRAVANMAILPLSRNGTLCARSSLRVDLVIDAMGWWGGAGQIQTVTPARLLDTRVGFTTIDGNGLPGSPLAAGQVLHMQVAGRAGLGMGKGAALNVVATRADKAGQLTVWACDQPRPPTANVHYPAAEARATLTVTGLAGDGSVCVASTGSGRVEVVIDATGWFPSGPEGYVPIVAWRSLDQRVS